MPEKIDAFLLADRVEERTDFAPEAWNGSLSGLSQECFEFAEDLLDRIEIGGVLGQIECGRTRGLDRFRHTGHLVGPEVVHDDDITAIERRSETLLDIGEKDCPIHRSINHKGRDHPVLAQAGNQGDRLPMPVWNESDQSFAAPASPPESHHVGAGGGLIDEYQPGGVEHALLSHPASARPGHVRPLLLTRAQAFFKGDIMSLEKSPDCGAAAWDSSLVHR